MPHHVQDDIQLELIDVTKTFGAIQALCGVSLRVRRGEFVCFLGPSGCGKTTLLRIVAGLEPPTGGRVMIDGRDAAALSPGRRGLGIVFQSHALFPNLTVAANIAYGLKGMDRAARSARVAELLALVGLPDMADRHPGQLSGGQRQRVALARALAPEPGTLLLDEPLSALDARTRVGLRGAIRALHDRLGVTTVMVTHDREEALTMADRIVVMNHGVIEQVGTGADIHHHPVNRFVADFMGDMNFLDGVVTEHGVRVGGLTLDCGGGGFPIGHPVVVGVRPEDVVVGANGSDVFSAIVEESTFLGALHRVRLRVAGLDGALIADVPADRARSLGSSVGAAVAVTLSADRLTLFPGNQR